MVDTNHTGPTEEQIRERAYELYQARGAQAGSDIDDWIAAEKDLMEQSSSAGPKTKSAKAG